MGRLVPESAPGRRSIRTVLAAWPVATTLLLFGLGTSGMTVPVAAIESVERRPQQEGRPLPRSYHAAAVVNGKIYVMGGAGVDNRPVASVQVYDPATAARADMPTPRALFGASAVRGTIYAVGGTTRGPDKLAVVEAYDTATDTWSRRADMPTPRNALSTAVVDGKVYAIGGWGFDRPEGGWQAIDLKAGGGAKDFSTVEVYDPETDTWATRADMPTPRSHMTVSALGGRIYAIGGGIPRLGADVFLSVIEVYDTATNRWSPGVDMPTPRSVPSSCVVDGRIYVMGGAIGLGQASSQEERARNTRPLSVVEIYDPGSGRWTSGRDLATARGWFSTSVVDGKVYVVGGRSLPPDGGILGVIPGTEVYTLTQ